MASRDTRPNTKHDAEGKLSKAGRRLRAVIVTVIVAALSVVFGVFIHHQYNNLMAVERRIAGYNRQIAEQQAITQELLRQRAIIGTAEHNEQVARQQLGLVHRNEIIFRRR